MPRHIVTVACRYRPFVYITGALMLLVVLPGLLKFAGLLPKGGLLGTTIRWLGDHGYLLVLVVLVADAVLMSRTRRRIRRMAALAARTDGAMCLDCGYLLRGLGDEGRCPECGTAFVREEVQRVWKRWAGFE